MTLQAQRLSLNQNYALWHRHLFPESTSAHHGLLGKLSCTPLYKDLIFSST